MEQNEKKPVKTEEKKKRRIGKKDFLVSGEILTKAVKNILKRAKLDRTWDIPYLAGYSRDGKTIFIDRHLPEFIETRTGKFDVDPFLILHESVEKALIDQLGLVYQHAHQIALRAEEAAVRAAGMKWREYDAFMQAYIKSAGHENLKKIPPDLDIKPYHDESDTALLKKMQQVVFKEESK